MPLFESVNDLTDAASTLRRRYHGVIEVRDGQLKSIRFRPWPTVITRLRVWQDIRRRAAGGKNQDVCHLYYDQLWRQPNFLVLKYVVSSPGTSFATARCAATTLDAIAEIKKSDAIVCEASNARISERLLDRWGWDRHLMSSSRRHYIKRLYPNSPPLRSQQRELKIFPSASEHPTPVVPATAAR
ncbi:hypothetical protein EC9_23600 [Rosistilla ulvae]|uniref:Uncharacterized protein n=1 Tax=Rosistilla ulvae TaxID=1930277 RepID=A0A517LZX6_9BACT|nr:hypothetical protein [Rosistilla ulvae]QDS88172.1 hypothetical protein EC9_23600 [Rosistilla ulvae]